MMPPSDSQVTPMLNAKKKTTKLTFLGKFYALPRQDTVSDEDKAQFYT